MFRPCLVAAAASLIIKDGFFSSYAEERKDTEPKLVQVQVIFRHGARTPVFIGNELSKLSLNLCKGINRPPGVSFDTPPGIPSVVFAQLHVTDIDGEGPRPYSSVDRFQASVSLKGGECRLGQLTDVGAMQSTELGKELRERYQNHLAISPENLHVRSTNVGRCLATLSAMLGSFLDLNRNSTSKNHTVIPVKTIQSNKEYMTPNHSNCEVLRTYFRQGREVLAKHFEDNESELKKTIDNILPDKVLTELKVNQNNFIRVHDWVKILSTHRSSVVEEEIQEFNLDKIIDEMDIHTKLRQQAAIEVATLMGVNVNEVPDHNDLNSEAKQKLKFAIGLFLKELHDNLFNHRKEKIFFYSGHDTTLIPLMLALGIYDMEWPEYCANIAIELWDVSGDIADDSSRSDSESLTDLISPVEVQQNIDNYEVRIVYNGVEVKRMNLSTFRMHCQELIPKNSAVWDRDCELIPFMERKKLENIVPGGSSF